MSLESGNASEEKSNKKTQPSYDELLKIISEQNKRVSQLEKSITASSSNGLSAADLVTIVKGVSDANKRDINYEEGIQEEQIDPEDFDQKGVRFTCPSAGYVLVDDRRKGMIVKLPYNKKSIFFKHASTRRVYQGKYESMTPISAYTAHSKKEIEWLRKHSLYNIMFYETTNQSAHADAIRATKLARIMNVIKNYEHVELISVCRQHGVQVNEDPAITRSSLAIEILRKEEEVERTTTNRIMQDTYKNTLIKNDTKE